MPLKIFISLHIKTYVTIYVTIELHMMKCGIMSKAGLVYVPTIVSACIRWSDDGSIGFNAQWAVTSNK